MTSNSKKRLSNGTSDGIALIPQPSDDPKDPLNWPTWKKNLILFTVCLGAFGGVASTAVHQLAYVLQASYYHRDPTELSYSISAGIAGVVGGPLLLVPLSSIVGRSSLVFWSCIVTTACNVWGPLMTGPNDYIPFVMSRLVAGFFGSIPGVLASGYIMDIYFLHQRGKAFTALEVAYLSGFLVTPALGGFIANSRPWPYVFWWLVSINGLSAILAFFVLEETRFERDRDFPVEVAQRSYFAGRAALFFPGTAVTPRVSAQHLYRRYINPILIGLSPVTIIAGTFVVPINGFLIGIGITSTIFLQTPEKVGGYGFTPLQNAAFNTSWWFGLIATQICGFFLSDRVPLHLARRNGNWYPEYRLYNIFIVIAASPLGLGIFGAGLQYHLHFMVLALGVFLVMFGGTYSTPITVNYVTECFPQSALEVSVIMGVYRQIFGLSLPFFVLPWKARVGAGWLLGTMAFICVFVSIFIVILVFQGRSLRQFNLVSEVTEDGVDLVSAAKRNVSGDSNEADDGGVQRVVVGGEKEEIGGREKGA